MSYDPNRKYRTRLPYLAANVSLVGQQFNLLTVISEAPKARFGARRWNCKCECGGITIAATTSLRNGHSQSCGCIKRTRHLKSRTRGLSRTPLGRTWTGMIRRCTDANEPGYANYGGRGITVCERWRDSIESFIEDMGERPFPGASIDRINVNGNYEPSNCRWATRVEQARNTRRNRFIEFNGAIKTLTEWAALFHLRPSCISRRLDMLGWAVERALTTPSRFDRIATNKTG